MNFVYATEKVYKSGPNRGEARIALYTPKIFSIESIELKVKKSNKNLWIVSIALPSNALLIQCIWIAVGVVCYFQSFH